MGPSQGSLLATNQAVAPQKGNNATYQQRETMEHQTVKHPVDCI